MSFPYDSGKTELHGSDLSFWLLFCREWCPLHVTLDVVGCWWPENKAMLSGMLKEQEGVAPIVLCSMEQVSKSF